MSVSILNMYTFCGFWKYCYKFAILYLLGLDLNALSIHCAASVFNYFPTVGGIKVISYLQFSVLVKNNLNLP